MKMMFKEKINLKDQPILARGMALKKTLDKLHSNVDQFDDQKYGHRVCWRSKPIKKAEKHVQKS